MSIRFELKETTIIINGDNLEVSFENPTIQGERLETMTMDDKPKREFTIKGLTPFSKARLEMHGIYSLEDVRNNADIFARCTIDKNDEDLILSMLKERLG